MQPRIRARRAIFYATAIACLMSMLPARAGGAVRNGLIAYDDDAGGRYHLMVAEPDGRHPRQVPLPNVDALWPSWSPDGAWLAFSAVDRSGEDAVFVAHPDGSMLREVGTAPGGLTTPSWSPDGRWIAAAHDLPTYTAAARSEVVVLPAGGGAPRVVATVNGAYVWSPVWAAKGDTIVFSAEQAAYDRNSDADINAGLIESVHLDGSGLQVLATGSTPGISPDGHWIAYTAGATELAGGQQVHVMTADGQRDHVVGQFGWYGYWTRFSPDGRTLLCEGQDDPHGAAHLYRMNLATGARTQLTAARSDQVLPDQQPVR